MKIEEIWNEQTTSDVEIELSTERRNKSVNLVSKILNRLKLERTTTYAVAPILIIFIIYYEAYLFLFLVGIYILGLLLYYHFIIRKISSVSIEESVLNYLKHVLYTLRWFRVHYLIMGFVSFLLGLSLTNDIFQFEEILSLKPIWIISIFCVMIATPLLMFYIHFNPHLKKIKKTVVDLEEDSIS